MIPQIDVALIVTGQSVTEQMVNRFRAMGATKCWQRGDPKQGTSLTYAHNGCSFAQDPVRGYYVEEVAFAFLEQLLANDALFLAIREYELKPLLSIGVYAADVIPGISLDVQQLQLLADHTISLDVDIMLVSP